MILAARLLSCPSVGDSHQMKQQYPSEESDVTSRNLGTHSWQRQAEGHLMTLPPSYIFHPVILTTGQSLKRRVKQAPFLISGEIQPLPSTSIRFLASISLSRVKTHNVADNRLYTSKTTDLPLLPEPLEHRKLLHGVSAPVKKAQSKNS